MILQTSVKVCQHQKKQKCKSKTLIYQIQAALRGKKRAQKEHELKKKKKKAALKAKQQHKDAKVVQTEAQLTPELRQSIGRFIDNCLEELQSVRLINVDQQSSSVQFVIFGEEPSIGRRYECNLSDSTNNLSALFMHDQDLLICPTSISQTETSTKPTAQTMPSNGFQTVLPHLLTAVICAAALYGILSYFYWEPIPAKPASYWDWFLWKLNKYLQQFFYTDLK